MPPSPELRDVLTHIWQLKILCQSDPKYQRKTDRSIRVPREIAVYLETVHDHPQEQSQTVHALIGTIYLIHIYSQPIRNHDLIECTYQDVLDHVAPSCRVKQAQVLNISQLFIHMLLTLYRSAYKLGKPDQIEKHTENISLHRYALSIYFRDITDCLEYIERKTDRKNESVKD